MNHLNTILHPTDFSHNAQQALKLACDLARDHRARLIVLHVAPPLPYHWTAPRRALPDFHKHARDGESRLLSAGCRDVHPERMLMFGEPAPVIVRAAKEVSADLIVIGKPQPSPWRWLIEERVAQSVARTAPCPVLVATSSKAQPAMLHEWDGRDAVRARAIALDWQVTSPC